MGSLHIQCDNLRTATSSFAKDKPITPSAQKLPPDAAVVIVHHEITEQVQNGDGKTCTESQSQADYRIHVAGRLSKATIVDTTGAGDAFIGAYLLMKQFLENTSRLSKECDSTEVQVDSVQLCLEFASWVAGRKLTGPGARSALPSGKDVDHLLGTDLVTIQKSLQTVISPFGG